MPLSTYTAIVANALATISDRLAIPKALQTLRDEASTIRGEIETRLAALEGSETSALGFVPIPITAWTDGGGPLVPFDDGVANGIGLHDSEALGYRFNPVGEDTSTLVTNVPLPPDLDDAEDVVLHVECFRVGAADVTTVLVGSAFFHVAGAAHTADADAITADSAAIDEATTIVAEKTLTIAGDDVPPSPASVTLTLTVDAALDADDLVITSTWLTYTKKLVA